MSGKILTYLDTGVLLAVMRGEPGTGLRAYNLLNGPRREFIASDALALELLPNAVYFKNQSEQQFCESFLNNAAHRIEASKQLFDEALQHAKTYGLAAMDALHLASALAAGASEIITTEKATKPIHRVAAIKVSLL
ncbi:MAG: PIN domain-containing protein [Pyrinomonadaceae bacterium]